MQNLRDKLLKAGLVTEDEAKKSEADPARHHKERSAPPPAQDGPPPRNTARPQGERPQGFRGERPPERRGERPRGERPSGPRPSSPPPSGPRPERPPQRPSGPRPPARAAPEELRIPKLPPMPGSKAAQRMESKKQLENDKKLRDLVHTNQVPVELGARTFYFVTRKNRLRRLEVSEEQATALETGKLAVVERPEPAQIEHSLVPPEVAEQMLAISPKSVRFFNRGEAPVGFISDDELKERQETEKTAGPEEEGRDAAGGAEAAAESAGEATSEGAGEATSEGEPPPSGSNP